MSSLKRLFLAVVIAGCTFSIPTSAPADECPRGRICTWGSTCNIPCPPESIPACQIDMSEETGCCVCIPLA